MKKLIIFIFLIVEVASAQYAIRYKDKYNHSDSLSISGFSGGAGTEWIIVNSKGAIADSVEVGISATDTAASGYMELGKTANYDFTNYDFINIRFRIDTLANLNNVGLLISNSSYAKYFAFYSFWDYQTGVSYPTKDKWFSASVPKSAFTSTNSPTWAVIDKMKLRVQAKTGKIVKICFDTLYVTKNPLTKSVMIPSFDDGWKGQYTQAYRIMSGYGFKGSIYVAGSLVGGSYFMSTSQLRTLDTAGWDIANHTYHHDTLMGKSAAHIDSEMIAQYNWAASNGFLKCVRLFAWPFGRYDDTSLSHIGSYVDFARTTNNVGTQTFSVPICNPLHYKTVYIANITTLDTVKVWLDRQITNKLPIQWAWHDIHDSTESTDWPVSRFDSFMVYVKTKVDVGLLDVMPLSQYLRRSGGVMSDSLVQRGTTTKALGTFGSTPGTIAFNAIDMLPYSTWANDSIRVTIPSWMPRGYYTVKIYDNNIILLDSLYHGVRVRTPNITGGE